MSGFIPIVSSSPPPLDESAANNNDEDDWDDFAQFTGAPIPELEETDKCEQFFSPIDPPDSCPDDSATPDENQNNFGAFTDQAGASEGASDWANVCPTPCEQFHSSNADCDFGGFAAFQDGSSEIDGAAVQHTPVTEQNGSLDSGSNSCLAQGKEEDCTLSSPDDNSKGLYNNGLQASCRSETQDVTSLGSAADSGLSSDVSPSAKAGDVSEDFAAKVDQMVHGQDVAESHGEDSGTETEDRDVVSGDEQSSVVSGFPKQDMPSQDSNHCNQNENDEPQSSKLSDSISDHSPGTLTESLSDKTPQIASSAKDNSGSNDGCNSGGLAQSDIVPLDPATSVSVGQTTDSDITESLHMCDVDTDSVNQTKVQSCDVSQCLASNSAPYDMPSHPTSPHQAETEEFDDFTEFKDALETQVDEVGEEGSEPEAVGFHFKVPAATSADESPVESLDLKLPATDIDTPQGDEWGDDFADFQEAGQMQEVDIGKTSSDWAAFGDSSMASETGDNWAAFNEADTTSTSVVGVTNANNKSPAQKDEDDFGDFEDVPVETFQTPSISTANILQTLGNINQIKKILNSVFNNNDVDSAECLDIDLLLKYMEKEKLIAGECEQKTSAKEKMEAATVCVWRNLRDISNTAALKYTWNNSVNRQKLLEACSIDTRNILLGHKKPSVPIFYQQAVLEPSRGPLEPTKPTTPSSPKPEVLVPEMTGTPAQTSHTASSNVSSSSVISSAGTPQDIPPAEFDWSSSGLTNPLDESSSIHLDLDFFIQKDSSVGQASVLGSKALQQEQEILQALEASSGGRAEPPKTLQSIETLLAGMKFTPTAPATIMKKEETVSAEAQHILDTLPDLSFMHASVLMFPLKVNSDQGD